MAALSKPQLTALSRIHFSGLIFYNVDSEFAMAFLDTPPGISMRVNVASARRLIRDELIELDKESEIEDLWRTTPSGKALLNLNKELLASAGRERAHWEGSYFIAMATRQALGSDG